MPVLRISKLLHFAPISTLFFPPLSTLTPPLGHCGCRGQGRGRSKAKATAEAEANAEMPGQFVRSLVNKDEENKQER
jgi:hypothetical protein